MAVGINFSLYITSGFVGNKTDQTIINIKYPVREKVECYYEVVRYIYIVDPSTFTGCKSACGPGHYSIGTSNTESSAGKDLLPCIS